MSFNESAFHLGTSGWAHRAWEGKLYPHDCHPREYLTIYAEHFNTVEIEYTLYQIPTREMVQSWYHRTPEGFIFCPCMPRQITHEKRLRNTQRQVENFLAIMLELDDKLGPILLQLPEDFRHTEHEQLERFLDTLPAEQLFAIEFRHGSWLKEATFAQLEALHIAWVVVDAPFMPRVPRVTANFAYIRWHGYPGVAHQAKRQINPSAALSPWVPIIRQLQRQAAGIYGYVHNRFSGYAARDCQVLQGMLGDK
jgi:uncharacterized protein YecE (DUF72 family)